MLLARFTGIAWALVLSWVGATNASEANEVITDKLGKKIEDTAVVDLTGRHDRWYNYAGQRATVVVFLSFECPVSNSYSPLLADLYKQFSDKGIGFLGICPTTEPVDTVAKSVKEYQLPFPVVVDPKFAVVDAFKAKITPEAFVVDPHKILRYRGRIDNQWQARLRANAQVTSRDLNDALEALLAQQPIRVPATKAVGCPILLPRTAPAAFSARTPTYHRDVAPILQQRCMECHRPGAVGPFSLTNYKQAVTWGIDIKEWTQTGRMPPWKPVAGPAFHNERKMPAAEIATLAAWVDAGMPEGDPKDAPLAPTFADGWMLGTPDLILSPSADFHLGPSGNDVFRCFVVPTNLTEDKYVVAVEVKPGNPRVVHHTLHFFDTEGRGRRLEQAELARTKKPNETDWGPGYSVAMGVGFLPVPNATGRPNFGALHGWAPGQVPRFLPEGSGYFLPKGSDVIVQVHYHRNGKPETDRTQIGLYFAKKPVTKPWQTIVVPGLFTWIPANAANHVVRGAVWTLSDCTLYSVMPHMHLLGKSVKMTMTRPDEKPITLVDIRDWDYNWQETYWFREPIRAPKGTKLEIEAVYDNSANNPNNPRNPPVPVLFGEQTTNEMLFGFIGAISDAPGRIRFSREAPNLTSRQPKPAEPANPKK